MVHFFLCVLDGIDGKQARRTGTSGPLGELFDHGIDSLGTWLMPAAIYSVFGRGDFALPPDRVFYGAFISVFVTFIASHWEKYNTGVLYLPWGYDISQIVSVRFNILFLNRLSFLDLFCIMCKFWISFIYYSFLFSLTN